MKRSIRLTAMLSLVVTCAAAATYWSINGDAPQTVTTTPVVEGPLVARIRVSGEVINDRTVTLTALVDGQIRALSAQKGQRVRQGDLLAQFDDEQARAQMRRTRALVARAQATVNETHHRYLRLQNVRSKGGASNQDIEAAEAAWHTARADLKVAESDLVLARIYVDKFRLTAPFDGIVVEKTAEVGQWMEAGTTLLKVVALEGREIEAHVDAADSGEVKPGQPVTLSCDAFPGQEWRSTLHWIGPAVARGDPQNLNTFAVRMAPGAEAPPLLIGQQVDVNILTAERQRTLMLPFNAIHETGTAQRVAVITEGRIGYRPVTTGIESFTHVEILEGLRAGEEVVLFDDKPLAEGTPVRSAKTAAP